MQDVSVVMEDMTTSMKHVTKAKPIIEKLMNGGELLAVEGNDNGVCRVLDVTCGTDYIHVYREYGIVYGVASRFQNFDPDRARRPYNTFTVRKARESGARTEYEKRKTAIERGGMYPFLTMQAYVNTKDKEVESLAICKTTDLMEYVDGGYADENWTRYDKVGQAAFYIVDWVDFGKRYKLLYYERPDNKWNTGHATA